jgi:hypothetical protein
MYTKLWSQNLKGRVHLEDLGVDVKIILRVVGSGTDLPGLEQAPVTGCCEHGNEPSGSVKSGELPD